MSFQFSGWISWQSAVSSRQSLRLITLVVRGKMLLPFTGYCLLVTAYYFNMRYFFEISYNGTPYHGWQNQPNAISVQQVVEDCFTKVFRKKTEITGSGRTDTGVHCVRQFFHADIDTKLNEKEWLPKLNSILLGSLQLILYGQ